MRILRNKDDLESFILDESNDGGDRHNSWVERELRRWISPKEYPCAVFTYWGEGANGTFLVSEIVYLSDLAPKITS